MSNLGEYHHAEEAETRSHKLTAWIVLAIIVGGIGLYVVESGVLNPPPPGQQQNLLRGL